MRRMVTPYRSLMRVPLSLTVGLASRSVPVRHFIRLDSTIRNSGDDELAPARYRGAVTVSARERREEARP